MTIRVFSNYQLNWLKELMGWYTIAKLGMVDETGELIVEYLRGGDMNVIKIPTQKEIDADNAIYEIIQPKQLNGTK